MSKPKYFFHSLLQSAINPDYYKNILKSRLSSSLKYFTLLIFFVAVFSILLPMIISLPILSGSFKEIDKFYPSDLEIKIQNGQISTNQPEPYYIYNQNNSIVVIDTTGTLSDVPDSKTGVLVTKSKIITRDANGIEEHSYNLSSFKDSLTINKNFILMGLGKIKPLLLALVIFFFILIYPFIFLSILSFNLIYVLVIALFPLILSKVLNLGHTYKNLFKIALHAFTLPTILQFIFGNLLKITFPPFSFTLVYLAFMTTILISLKSRKTK